jgi:voltage-gated sodium channel
MAHDSFDKPQYDVTNFYWPKEKSPLVVGLCTHKRFENTTFAVIGINALWMGFDSDYNPAPTIDQARLLFQLGESFFCIYFTFEVLIRFLSFQVKSNCRKDAWFVFDSLLVTLMIAETWVMPLILGGEEMPVDVQFLRLLRLLRLARMVRLLKAMPDLLILVRAMFGAIRSCVTVVSLLFLLLYVFGIIFKMQLGNKKELNEFLESEADFSFENVPRAALCLFYSAALGDNCMVVFNAILGLGGITGYVMAFLYVVFIGLSMFTVLNMLIGVLCEIVSEISESSKEEIAIEFLSDAMKKVLDRVDTDGNGKISSGEFQAIIHDKAARDAMEQLDLEMDAVGFIGDFLFEKEHPDDEDIELEFEDFLEQILGLRSTNTARICDVMKLMKAYSKELNKTVDVEVESLRNNVKRRSENLRGRAIEKFVKAMDERICAKFDPIIARLETLAYPPTRFTESDPTESGSPRSPKSPKSPKSPRSPGSPRSPRSPGGSRLPPIEGSRLPPISPTSPARNPQE